MVSIIYYYFNISVLSFSTLEPNKYENKIWNCFLHFMFNPSTIFALFIIYELGCGFKTVYPILIKNLKEGRYIILSELALIIFIIALFFLLIFLFCSDFNLEIDGKLYTSDELTGVYYWEPFFVQVVIVIAFIFLSYLLIKKFEVSYLDDHLCRNCGRKIYSSEFYTNLPANATVQLLSSAYGAQCG